MRWDLQPLDGSGSGGGNAAHFHSSKGVLGRFEKEIRSIKEERGMFFIQSFIVAILCWLASNTTPCYGFTIGLYTLGRPLVGGFICGIIFGDIQTGILLGCALQVVYLALVTPGGAFPVDIGFISYPAIAIALVSKMDAGTAVR